MYFCLKKTPDINLKENGKYFRLELKKDEENIDNAEKTMCTTVEDALEILRKHEMEHTVRYSVWCSPKDFGKTGKLYHFHK